MAKKDKKSKATEPGRKETIETKHEFTQAERITLLDELSRSTGEIESLKEQKKTSMSDWSNRIKSVELKVKTLSSKAQAGYEMRPTECIVKFRPKDRKKDYSVDGKIVETRDMTEADFEMPLFESDKPINPVADAFEDAEGQE